MTYFKVKPEYHDHMLIRRTKAGNYKSNTFLIANELFTPGEMKHIINSPKMFDRVQIPMNKTFFCFGARFEVK